jgi:hypothetical protein
MPYLCDQGRALTRRSRQALFFLQRGLRAATKKASRLTQVQVMERIAKTFSSSGSSSRCCSWAAFPAPEAPDEKPSTFASWSHPSPALSGS